MYRKQSLIERARAFLQNKIPLWRGVPLRTPPHAEGNFIASGIDADRLHRILALAQQGDCSDLFDLYRDIISADAHIQSEFFVRKIRLLGEQISVLPFDEKNSEDVRAADAARDMLESIPDRTSVLAFLMDSCLYPVSVVEKVFRPSRRAELAYELDRLVPVPHRLLDFSDGGVRVFDCEADGRKTSVSRAADRASYIIHRNHILSTPDYWGGPMRAILFWWLISAMDSTWWSQWLERYGLPFLVGKYETNDDDSRYVLQQAFATAARIGGIVATKETEIEFVNALSSQNGEAFEKLLQTCHREESKLILGQTLSSEAQATGLGSGVADSHEAVRGDIALFDMMCVGGTLKEQLVRPFLRYNGFAGRVPNIVVGGESETDLKGVADVLSALGQSGLQVGDDGLATLSKRCGFPIERGSPPPQLFSAKPPATSVCAADACDRIAETASAELARSFGASGAAVLRMLELSESPDDFEAAVEKFCAKWPAAETTAAIQDAITANIANGVSGK